MIFQSFISRVIILNILLLTVGIWTFSLFIIREEQNHLVDATRESAQLLLSTVEKSIFNSMKIGNSEEVQAVLELMGRDPRLENVRIFHPDGTILRSADPEEIGKPVSPFDLELFNEKRGSGIFHGQDQEVLGMIKPIVTEERCFACHGTGSRVVGILNINFSLAETTRKLRETSSTFMFSTAVLIILLSAGVSFLLLRFIKRPLHMLADKMALVEGGDLSVRTFPRTEDEIGSLMRSFNSMVDQLGKTKRELEQYHYRQMERADRLASVGEMASGIAHEIKNPLAGISGAISVLADDFPSEDPRREIVNQVLEQIARLNKTATDLLFFGKPGKPELTYVDLNSLVKNTLFFISQHPEARNIHRIKELSRDLPAVQADEKQIQQVLFNIIINAVQAMSGGGTLRIQTDLVRRDGLHFGRIRISDTGKGIPREELDKIFVPFYTTKTQGTGLGLPICRQLMEQHGGTIRVESRLEEGTTFIIELPVAEGQITEPKEDESAPT